MTHDEFEVWAKRHAVVFCFHTDRASDMLVAWYEVFELAGYHVDELQAATTWLAAFEPPRYLTEHLSALQRRISQERLARTIAIRELQNVRDTCQLCGGFGWVEVPKRTSVIDGQWVNLSSARLPTSCVTCSCTAGQSIANSHHSAKKPNPRPPMSLDVYTHHVPHWQELLKRREQETAARSRANAAAEQAETSGIVRRVAQAIAFDAQIKPRSQP